MQSPLKLSGTVWTNPGSVSRLGFAEMDSVPAAWVWDGDSEVILNPMPLRHHPSSGAKLSVADIAAMKLAKEAKAALQAEHMPVEVGVGHSHFFTTSFCFGF